MSKNKVTWSSIRRCWRRSTSNVQKSYDREKHVQFGEMWKFCSLFSSIATAWCVMNFCNTVIWSIRNTIMKPYADCAKQFFRNAQNCGKTNHRFCTMITHQLTNRCLYVSVWPKDKTVIMPQPLSSPELASADLFLFPKLKTPMKGKHFATIEKIKVKSKQVLLAIPKSMFQKCFADWKKRWHKCVTSEGCYFEGDKIVIDK